MADHVITITVPSAKVATALQGWLKIYPNEELRNPSDLGSGLKYTNSQWVTEQVRRLIVRDIRRGLQMLASEAAQVVDDDGIAVTS